jgi:hypothetical protein
MTKKKEKMYDFGCLGRWSHSTLEEQVVEYWHGIIGCRIPAIEMIYEREKRERECKVGGCIYIKFDKRDLEGSISISELLTALSIEKTAIRELDQLEKDYEKYRGCMTYEKFEIKKEE